MPSPDDLDQLATELRLSISLLRRRLRQAKAGDDELSLPESAALARLDRSGPASSADLARLEQISPQAMGTTLAALVTRGLVARAPDPHDRRRTVISITDAGRRLLRHRRNTSTALLAAALGEAFTAAELQQLAAAAPLLERLAQRI